MCKRTMYKRARIPMFLWERRACANSGAQAVFPRPCKNGLGTRLVAELQLARARAALMHSAVGICTLHMRTTHNAWSLHVAELWNILEHSFVYVEILTTHD